MTERETGALGPALLFCPGERPERFEKAANAADMAVLDLEDGTAAANKEAARAHVRNFVSRTSRDVLVRINHPTSHVGLADIEALRSTSLRRLLLSKTESPEEIATVLSAWGGDLRLIVTIETATGLTALPFILSHPCVEGVSWGPYDLAADIGARSVRDASGQLRSPFRYARDRLLIEAAACGVPAVTMGIGALRERVVHDRTGWIAGSVADMGAALVRVLGDDALWLRYHRASLEHPDLVSWEQRGAEWEAYLEALGAPRR